MEAVAPLCRGTMRHMHMRHQWWVQAPYGAILVDELRGDTGTVWGTPDGGDRALAKEEDGGDRTAQEVAEVGTK